MPVPHPNLSTLLAPFLPHNALNACVNLLEANNLQIKITPTRLTRHGDYRWMPNGKHLITLNATENKYRFLITLLHEIAHFKAFQKFGRAIKPHGVEWKQCFQKLMLPFLRPEVFPSEMLPALATHFKNPKASSDTDVTLALMLKRYDVPNSKSYIFELEEGTLFKWRKNRVFVRGKTRVKRIACTEVSTGRTFVFSPHAEVEILSKNE